MDSLMSTTLASFRPTISDGIFTRIPLLMWLKKKALLSHSGGTSIVVPVMFAKNSTAKSYAGYGVLDTTPQEGITAVQFKWAQYAATVTISGIEGRQNNSKEGFINLVDAKTKQAEMSLADKLDIDMWASSTSGSNILALPTIVDTTTSIGDQSKTSNTWWQAQVTASGSFAARGLADMRNLYNTIMNQSVDNAAVDVVFSSQSVYENYESTLQPQQRFTDETMAGAGFENLRYKGAMFTFDGNVPSGTLFMLRSDNLKLEVHNQANFTTSNFIQPTNQDARTAQILFQGQLTCDNIRKLGKLTSITA